MVKTSVVNVLLVDDDTLHAQQLAEMLERQQGFVCDRQPTVQQAETALATQRYHAALLSLSLSDYAGLAALALLQTLAPKLPILVIAAPEQETLALKAVHQGAADHLVRGQIYPTLVERAIRHAIEVARAREVQVQTELALQWERDFSSTVIDTAGCLIVVLDAQSRIVEFNRASERMSGYSWTELRGERLDLLMPAEERTGVSAILRSLARGRSFSTHENHWMARDGTRHLISWSNTSMRDEAGNVEFIVATGIPITERRKAEEALRSSETKYRALFEESRDAIFMTDVGGTITETNTAMQELLGFGPGELVGVAIDTLYAVAPDRELFRQEWSTKGRVRDFEVRFRRKDGEAIWCLLSLTERRLPGSGTIGYQGIAHDISDRKRAEERLLHNAFHDTLTGLPNRARLADRLELALARWHRHRDRLFAVLFLDLDRFKVVNDSMGHTAGDEMLVRIGRVLSECVREEDTVARLGGDEFAILLDHIDDTTDAVLVAERIHNCLEHPIQIAGQSVFTSCSVGIALPTDDLEKPEDLLRNADIAMYRAKGESLSRHAIYTPGMHSAAVSVMELDTDLRQAVQNNEFTLHYQPIFLAESGRVSGFEALLRWNHPRRGLLMPAEFLARAEDTGLILQIGRWVIREACSQLHIWARIFAPEQLPFISLNIAGRQLAQPDFVSDIAAVLHEYSIDGNWLMFELTETSLMQNPDSCAATIRRLRDLGIRFCIDDFGTGYSSLAYLHRLPISGLKIDRSFVSRLGETDEAREFVATIISLAASLGLDAVAEGVESELQLSNLRQLRTKYVQGFYFSAAVDPLQAIRMLPILA